MASRMNKVIGAPRAHGMFLQISLEDPSADGHLLAEGTVFTIAIFLGHGIVKPRRKLSITM